MLVILAVLMFGAGLFLMLKHLFVVYPPESAEARLVRIGTVEGSGHSASRKKSWSCPVWSFTTSDGTIYEVEGHSRNASPFLRLSVGDTSTIFYYPEHPDNDYVIEAEQKYSPSLSCCFVFFPIMFFVLVFITYRREIQQKRVDDSFVLSSVEVIDLTPGDVRGKIDGA
jgi:hypothetical protein